MEMPKTSAAGLDHHQPSRRAALLKSFVMESFFFQKKETENGRSLQTKQ